ncbi:ribosome modulation factor [Azospira oryzae PS]|uniref:Ribosome modulation factor n=1 Tax=Azospira oryzae (strain ATCC BAA-33 / DSM 13638 / PS) TaxID=640081 RepID=G8QM80_AZOOP|nr:Lrp/AsnC family transcriptional regulator [Azospira oryzae]AEV24596.1 ribosome modulation factor [Azospira oryzae PS]
MNAPQDFRNMTADTVGKDLLSGLLAEIRLLPKSWAELSKAKQDDVIDRLRKRVESNVKMAVHLLAAEGRIVVAGDLDQITIKDGVKAVIKFGAGAPNLHELYEVSGKQVLVVVANAADHTGGMNDIKGEADQRAMDLGHEYHDNDGGGMEDGGEVIEGEVLGLPSPDQVKPTDDELDQAYEDGYQAAADGKTKDDAPVIRYELVEKWLRGWSDWHEQNKADDAANDSTNNDEAA